MLVERQEGSEPIGKKKEKETEKIKS